jgi:hypothetical protein
MIPATTNIDAPSCRRNAAIPAATIAPLVAAFALLTAGCGVRDRTFAPSDFTVRPGYVVPAGVTLPTDTTGGLLHNFHGLYAETPESSVCCWLATHATLFVRKTRGAATFVAGVYTPEYPVYDPGQTFTIRFDDDRHTFVEHVGQEERTIRISLPPGLRGRSGLMPVRIDSRITFLPMRDIPVGFSWRALFGMKVRGSEDDRNLGAILLYAYFE